MKLLKTYALISLGTLLLAIGVYFFSIPNGFAMGGVSGLGTVLGKVTPISPGIWIAGLNILLLIVSFIILGKETGIRTAYCSLLYSAIIELFEILIPLEHPVTSQPVLELACTIILAALGMALVFRFSATTGGTDIIAMILKKYTNLDVGKALLVVDFLIACSSFFVFGVEIGIFSVFGLILQNLFIDMIIDSLEQCKYFIVITSKPDEITNYVLEILDHGATIVQAEGAYSHEGKVMLHTVCKRREAYKLQKKVREIDPGSFVIITSSSEIIGEGFRN